MCYYYTIIAKPSFTKPPFVKSPLNAETPGVTPNAAKNAAKNAYNERGRMRQVASDKYAQSRY